MVQAQNAMFDAFMSDALQLLPDMLSCIADSHNVTEVYKQALGTQAEKPFR